MDRRPRRDWLDGVRRLAAQDTTRFLICESIPSLANEKRQASRSQAFPHFAPAGRTVRTICSAEPLGGRPGRLGSAGETVAFHISVTMLLAPRTVLELASRFGVLG
jgi:hypothetical protein